MKKVDLLRLKIEEMRRTKVTDNEGRMTTIGDIARKESKSLKVENAVMALITTVLAMRQRWTETARPRVEAFKANYSHLKTLQDLRDLLESMDEREFCNKVLNLTIKKTPFPRYVMLKELIGAFSAYRKEKVFKPNARAFLNVL